MANRKDYTLIGLGADVQYGKGGGRFVWNTDHFESTSDGTTLAQLRVPLVPLVLTDAASKSYVDNVAAGLDIKDSVRAATVVAGALATDYEAGDVIDGITLVAGDRILLKDQANPVENGIFVVQATGAPVRPSNVDSLGELSGGAFVFIEEGTTLADTGWVITTNGELTPGTDANVWAQFSGGASVTAGVGLTQTGIVFNANVGATTISVNGSDDFIVNSSATAGQVLSSVGTIGVEATWGALDLANTNSVTGILDETNGGTGISTYVQGDILAATAANTLSALALGTIGQTLQSNGTDVVWADAAVVSGAVVTITADITFNGGATQAIGNIPAGGRVIKTSIDVTTLWDATETVSIGDAGAPSGLMATTENDPEEAIIFSTDNNVLYGVLTAVIATVSSATATAGTARVIVQYIQP